MTKQIAIYVDNFGKVTDLNKLGIIRIFSKDDDEWNIIKELPFKFQSTIEKENIRLDTMNISKALGNCKIFVAREFSDLVYTILDSMGLSVWKMEGDQNKILEYVLEKEEEEAEEIKNIDNSKFSDIEQIITPTEIGSNGYYILNLKELQSHNTGFTTKQVLKPFLNDKKFNELIITCSHLPHWLVSHLEKLNLNFEFSKTEQDNYIVVINHYSKLSHLLKE